MNFEKLTQKSVQALNTAREIAIENSNSSVEAIHVLYALLSDSDGLIPELCLKAGADLSGLREAAKKIIAALPSISGSGYSPDRIYMSTECEKLLLAAE